MKYSNIHLIYFSPTHTSAKIVYAIAEGMGATSMSESDVTCESLDMEEYIDDELTIIAAPVYGGRVAETAMERFRMFRSAHHAPVVPVVLYGNRDYEDALKELCDLVSEQGFVPVAAGAFIGEHSFSRKGMPIAEGRPDESDLNQATEFGKKIIDTKLGSRAAMHAYPFFEIGLGAPASENTGDVLMGTIGWTGNYRFTFEVDNAGNLRVISGINPYASAYELKPNEWFVTPEFIFTLSNQGTGKASRDIHDWARNYQIKDGKGDRLTLLNNWESTGFNFNEKKLEELMKEAKHLGVDMFLLDDGWFANKYPRQNDKAGLGDWEVTHDKLPNGIPHLVQTAKDAGVKFGIWIEPEMANTTSELYEKHPEWVLKAPNREIVLGRGGTQVVLDLSNPEVQDFIFGIVDNLMTTYPEIDYIKWDANMSILNHGSQYLPSDQQSHMYIEYHEGFKKVCERIRAKYPDLTLQACASGGGRANYGVMPYFDEFWVSDNTDALQRIYMQWGTSYFFPAIAMASHISAAPNHQTFRVIPLKYRIDVAMSGRLGMEIQPKNMTEEEKTLCRKAIADYKTIRPVVQFGDIYRLVSPYDRLGVASLMYTSPEKDKAVFYWWKTEHFVNQHLPRVKMNGLSPDKKYRVCELNRIDNEPLAFEGKAFTGEYLMANGLEIPYNHIVDYHKQNDYSSRVLYLEEVK